MAASTKTKMKGSSTMLNAIIRLSLQNRALVLAVCLVVLVYGGYLTTTMPIDVFPDLDRPRVVILTECPGLSSEEVETLVTQPIETAILGASGVEAVRSQSSQGMNVIYVEFGWRTETRYARQVVMERMANVPMPPGIRPQMTPPASIMGQILHVGLHRRKGPGGGDLVPVGTTGLIAERVEADGKLDLAVWSPYPRNTPDKWESVGVQNPAWDAAAPGRTATFAYKGKTHLATFRTPLEDRMDLRTTANWIVRPRLLKQPGIAEVIIMGGDIKQYQVLVDPDKLLEYNVSLQEVEAAIKANNLNTSGGVLEEGQGERAVVIVGRLGPLPKKVVDDVLKIPVKAPPSPLPLPQWFSGTNGFTSFSEAETGARSRTVLVKHIAKVEEGPAPKRGDASIDGNPGVVVTVVKQPHADTRKLTDAVKAALRDTELTLPADVVVNTDLFQIKTFIDRGVYYVEEALVIGAILVVIVLFLFLLNLRTTFITLTAIPLSLVITTLVFRLIGVITGTELSINVMTLGGIAVAMGELVDDAIVDVENIFRRLSENNASTNPKPALLVVYEASREIRSAIVFGTAVVVLAFMPLFALSGVEGRLFVPLGIAYIVSILASLVVSLTVTPVLAYYLLPQSKATHGHQDGFLLRTLKWMAGYLIRFSMRHAGALLLVTWLLVGVCAVLLMLRGADFLPKFDEGSVQVNVALPGGSSLKASNEASALIDARLKMMLKSSDKPQNPILHFARRTGRAELDEHAQPVNIGEYILTMNPDADYRRDEFLTTLRTDLKANVPGVEIETEQPLNHLISHMLSGVNAQVAVKIYGDDLDKLRKIADEVRAALLEVDGVTPPIIDPQERVNELHIVLEPDDLAHFAISREYVGEFVKTAMKGEAVSQVLDGQRRFDLVVKLQEPQRTDPDAIKNLRLDLPNGRGQIRLKDVASFPSSASGPNLVNRENVRRKQVVRCNVTGRDLQGAVADIEAKVNEKVKKPEGYFIEFGGQFEAQRSATLTISLLAVVSMAGIFVVLMMLYPSARISLQILNAIPTAFIGGMLALVLTNQSLTVASLIGFVSLGGIAVRNGILLVTHYFHLMKEEGEGFSESMIQRGSLERLAPVLMTALTAGIGLIPLVISGNKPGLEILYPVATVILGGLVTSTFCEFLLHPGLFWKFSGKDAERLVHSEGSEEELLRTKP
jgi:CzcA family heavy metal efflux pump